MPNCSTDSVQTELPAQHQHSVSKDPLDPQPKKMGESRPRRVRPKRRARLAYLLGSANLCLVAFWLGSYPSTFHHLYSVKTVLLMLHRWMSFKKQKMHYYMFDFCYVAQAYLLLYLWFWPKSNFLLKVVFAYSCGPLPCSLMLFQNSLVYHKIDEFTSLYIHWYPLLVVWTLRWYPADKFVGPNELLSGGDANAIELVLWPMLLYLAWAIFYYVKIFVISSGKIKEREYETLYLWMMSKDQQGFPKFINRFGPKWRPFVYMMCHFIAAQACLVLGIFCWNSFIVHSALVAVATGVSMWNGASHYLS